MMEPLEPPDLHYLSAAIGWLGLGNAAEAEKELGLISVAHRGHPDVLEVRWIISAEQKQWVTTAAAEVSAKEPAKAFDLERAAATKLKSIGVKIVTDVDKSGFTAIADPYLDKLAKELGPHADKIKTLIRAIN